MNYQERLIAQFEQMEEWIRTLGKQIKDSEGVTAFEELPVDEQNRMHKQHKLMQETIDVMRERIDAFGIVQ